MAIREVEELRHRQRKVGEEIARLGRAKQDASTLKQEMKGVADRIKALETALQDVEAQIRQVLLLIPNVPDSSVPVGPDSEHNVEVRRVGTPRVFDFQPKAHWDLGSDLGILDFERAAKISGARFVVLHQHGARVDRALIQFMLDVQTRERRYREVLPPYLVTADKRTMYRS